MPPPYNPVGRCVYCGSPTYSENEPERRLGDEHIVPLAFRGRETLREASCEEHERSTSQLEDHCVRHLLKFGRPHLGLRGRKSRLVPPKAIFTGDGEGRGVNVLADEHPGYMLDFTYPYPNFLLGSRPASPGEALLNLRPLVPDFEARVVRLGGTISVHLAEQESIEVFAKLLAKIAHVYAVAELGLDGFDPWLPPLILGASSRFGLTDLVGSGVMPEPPSSTPHEVGFSTDANVKDAIVVRIRLFANIQRPPIPHYVVVGSRV